MNYMPDSIGTRYARVAAGIHLPRLLKAHGVDPILFMAEQGLDASLLADPENLISYAAHARLYKEAAEATGCDHLPVLVGLSAGFSELGPLGVEMLKAASVGDAWKAAERPFHLQVSGAKLSLNIVDGLAEISYLIVDREVVSGGHLSTGALAYICAVMTEMCGLACHPVSADLPLRAVADKTQFKRVFGPKVKFNCARAVVRFDAHWMTKVPALERDCSEPMFGGAGRADLVADTQAAFLREALEGHVPSAEHVARHMGFSQRTLARRLSERNTSFEEIRKAALIGASRRLLNDTDMSITAIALALGYSEVAAFTRAFHSWTGYPPSHFRPVKHSTGSRTGHLRSVRETSALI